MQYLRPHRSDNRMLYGTCTITKALGASLFLTDYMWYFWKYVLGTYASLGVYCMYAIVGVYCMYATVRFLLWTQCSTGQKWRLSVNSGLWKLSFWVFPLNTFCLVMIFSNECLNGWIPVMLSYTTPLFGCEPYLSPNK